MFGEEADVALGGKSANNFFNRTSTFFNVLKHSIGNYEMSVPLIKRN
jgi:hypothetical protein